MKQMIQNLTLGSLQTAISTVGVVQSNINQQPHITQIGTKAISQCPFCVPGDKTMIQISPTIKLFTYRETNESGLQIMSLVFSHNCNNYHLQGGTRDTIYIFTESIGIYVLTVNKSLGYMGLNSYMAPEPDPINSMFLHNHQEITEHLGSKWEGLKAETIVKKLIQYLY